LLLPLQLEIPGEKAAAAMLFLMPVKAYRYTTMG